MSYLAVFIFGASLFFTSRFFPFSSLFAAAIVIALLGACRLRRAHDSFRQRTRTVVIIVLVAAAGFFYAHIRYVAPLHPSAVAGTTIAVKGTVSSEPLPLSSRDGMFLQQVAIDAAETSDHEPLPLKELRVMSRIPLTPDTTYSLSVAIPREGSFLNPGTGGKLPYGYAVAVQEHPERPALSFGPVRAKIGTFIKSSFSPEAAAFLLSIVIGERSLMSEELNNAFNRTGLAHLLSISGAHFGLLFFILFRIFSCAVVRLPYSLLVRLTLYATPSQIAALLSLPFMAGYLGISSASIPAVRAFIMIALFLFGLFVQREGFWLASLLFAAVLIILMHPGAMLDLSFQLSFIAVLCIGMVAERTSAEARKIGSAEETSPEERRLGSLEIKEEKDYRDSALQHFRAKIVSGLPRFRSSALGYLRSSLLISLAATVGTAPLVAYSFHYFSLVSPLTNLVITPLVGFVILPLALAASSAFLIFGAFPDPSFIDKLTCVALDLINYAARWDMADIKIPAFPLILLLMFYCGMLFFFILNIGQHAAGRSRLHRFAAAFSVTIAILPSLVYAGFRAAEQKELHITYLDVGQGDAAVVELPDERVLVVDTGRNGFQVGAFLRYRGIRRIDAVVLSHGQSDHAGGMEYLLKHFDVQEVWDNDRLVYADGFLGASLHRGFQRGDVIEGSGYRIDVFHPYSGFYTPARGESDENNDSFVFKIRGRKNDFLFAGDIESAAAADLSSLDAYLRSTVLKVPHHGSRSAASEAFFRAVSPEIAVISVGRNNRYGHPHHEILEMLGTTKTFRTDSDDAIGLVEHADGTLDVRTWSGFQLGEARTIRDEVVNFKKLFLVW
ncbi:MAG: ComEC/Rec2 family competence protein [Nitrospirota bacterium]